MLLDEFKAQLRFNRGKLTSMDEQMDTIHSFGSAAFIEYALKEKHIGVGKMSNIVENLSCEEQDEFVKWVCSGVHTVQDIDLKLLEMGA